MLATTRIWVSVFICIVSQKIKSEDKPARSVNGGGQETVNKREVMIERILIKPSMKIDSDGKKSKFERGLNRIIYGTLKLLFSIREITHENKNIFTEQEINYNPVWRAENKLRVSSAERQELLLKFWV